MSVGTSSISGRGSYVYFCKLTKSERYESLSSVTVEYEGGVGCPMHEISTTLRKLNGFRQAISF